MNSREMEHRRLRNGQMISLEFRQISVVQLRKLGKDIADISGRRGYSRTTLYEAILELDEAIQNQVVDAVRLSVLSGKKKYARKSVAKKTVAPTSNNATAGHNIQQRSYTTDSDYDMHTTLEETTSRANATGINIPTDNTLPTAPMAINSTVDQRVARLIAGPFMRPPSEESISNAIQGFTQATNNEALQTSICSICARELSAASISRLKLALIPNKQLLIPETSHPRHDIFEHMLLHPTAVHGDEADTCDECIRSLRRDQLPKHALANNMWIGDIPRELRVLTLPERILIARYFPAAYIVKLYPKKKGSHAWDNTQMHSGLRGNVSTYKLDPNEVTKLVDATLMPPGPKILSATIGITFIGPKNLPERTMPGMFRVRRARVKTALEWLKVNNPIYSDIQISEENLQELPEDGIPDEIMFNVKHSTDMDRLYQEQESYIPTDAADEVDDIGIYTEEEGLIRIDDDVDMEEEPSIMPMQSLGIIDIDGIDISADEIMAHALANSAEFNMPEDFTIKRGSAFINEYARTDENGQRIDGGPSRPNHLLGCFPVLFPYGKGGFETARPKDVPYETHARWAMQYADKRFRKDYQFPYQVFGICQKRQVCRSAILQMKRSSYINQESLIRRITPKDLIAASQEETRGVPYSNVGVRALRKQLSAVRTRVTGMDESRQSIRSKIWGTNLLFNPPNLWVTINPADTQDPIAQVIAGVDINLDEFCKTAGPDNSQRAVNMANDPYAAAKFFHFIINVIIEQLFGIKKKREGQFERKEGVLGYVQSYIGTVEAQGRGTLHLHMLLWLKDAPSSSTMQEALKNETFRDKVKHYIQKVIKADINEKSTSDILQSIPKEGNISYSRPDDPQTTTKMQRVSNEHKMARALQLHQCSTTTCLKVIQGSVKCKRGAPFPLARDDFVNENGEWGPKRHCAYLNNWNSPIMRCMRCNHDIKLMMNGAETKSVTWYITSYATKKQARTSNICALLAKTYAYNIANPGRYRDIHSINKRMIQHCANSITRNREFSALEVISYVMAYGDRFESHFYATIYWDPVASALKNVFPALRLSSIAPATAINSTTEGGEPPALITIVDGKLVLKDQLKDYQFRGEQLSYMSFFRFMLDTYEGKSTTPDDYIPVEVEEEDEDTHSRAGRPRNNRIPYKSGANKPKRCRIMRTTGHETLPRFVGRWFERNDQQETREMYCASMLALLKPWDALQDLKCSNQSFSESWMEFYSTIDDQSRTVVENIQYFHECSDSANARRDATDPISSETIAFEEADEELERRQIDVMNEDVDIVITEEDVSNAREKRHDPRELIYSQNAMYIADKLGIFQPSYTQAPLKPVAPQASINMLDNIRRWDKQLKETTRNPSPQGPEETQVSSSSTVNVDMPLDVEPMIEAMDTSADTSSIKRPLRDKLNSDQRRAHDIIEKCLTDLLSGAKNQLKMLVLGQGGTGKSLLIAAVTETFQYHNSERLLAKCGTSGISASGIKGQTLHSWAGIAITSSTKDNWVEDASAATKKRRKENIEGVEFLIVDEISMATKMLLYQVSTVIGHIRGSEGKGDATDAFANMNVILFGDFHQFPPVANSNGALYHESIKDNVRALLGRQIYHQFDTVVILKEQMRVKDQDWIDILGRLRVGECTDEDIDTIRKLVLTDPRCDIPDFDSEPWNQCILVTPRHAVREEWNAAALRKHCAATGNLMYIAPAEDTISATDAPVPINGRIKIAQMSEKQTGKLPEVLEIAVGMRLMVTSNIATEADIANGTRGTITDILLDPRENPIQEVDENGAVKLKYPPAMILFRPDDGTELIFPDLPAGVIPLTPSISKFPICMGATTTKKHTHTIKRRQYAITAAYAFTDYKSQGQTLEYVIIDIGELPTGSLSPFSVYVALSRSRGRDTIRLLRDFDDQLFITHPSESLRVEMKRIELLDIVTKIRYN